VKACVQRVSRAQVTIEGEVVGRIGRGVVILLGVAIEDDTQDARYLAEKISGLRIFDDVDGKMNRSLIDVGGDALVVSQFTLLGDCRKGRRPSFIAAASPSAAEKLYECFVAELRRTVCNVATGRFGASMLVELVNDGPVTLLLDSTT
jgi:D-tyrosyl-tRNA(Tyr) deacylase